MSMHTRCTHCEAVFRVTLLQLQSSSGRVRCGVCREVFDAFVHLRAADPPAPEPVAAPEPLPPIDLPKVETPRVDLLEEAASLGIDAPGTPEVAVEMAAPPSQDTTESFSRSETTAHGSGRTSKASSPDIDEFIIEHITESATPGTESIHSEVDDTPGEAEGWPSADEDETSSIEALHDAMDTSRSTDADTLTPSLAIPAPKGRQRRWPLVAGVSAALLLLAGQATYQFRTAIATALPALRPVLESTCALAGCSVPLPRLPERLVIETSDLRALDPSRPNRVVLATTVRNAAPMAQAYPMLELSLTDARDKLTARKVFSPQEYLDAPPAMGTGLGANAEFSVRMHLDVGDIEASGYRIYLFHR